MCEFMRAKYRTHDIRLQTYLLGGLGTLEVRAGLVDGGEHTSGLNNELGTILGPRNLRRVLPAKTAT